MRAAISGLGAWYPEEVRLNSDWPKDFAASGKSQGDRTFNDIPEALDEVARVTSRYLKAEEDDPFLGVEERRFAGPHISSVQAECYAAERALADANLAPGDIDTVISYSVTPDRLTPASGPKVADVLGIKNAVCWGMDAACATALVQIATAKALVESGQARNVLLTQSHLLLRAFPQLHPAAPGLGDASTALVVSREGRFPILETVAHTHGEFYDSVTWIRDGEEDTPWWLAGTNFRVGSRDHAGAKQLQRDTVSFSVRTLRELIAKAGVDAERIKLLVSVEPRGWVPSAVAEIMGIGASGVSSVYRRRGHLGACGPIANLELAQREKLMANSGLIAMYAQGAGFTRAGILLQIDGDARAL